MGTTVGNVVNFPGETSLDIDANEMLKSVVEEFSFDSVVLVGFTGEEEFTMCSSVGKSADMVYLLEMGKHAILEMSQG